MQDRNKVLKGLGDRLTEEENEEVKCRQHALAFPGFGLRTRACGEADVEEYGICRSPQGQQLATQFASHFPRSRPIQISPNLLGLRWTLGYYLSLYGSIQLLRNHNLRV